MKSRRARAQDDRSLQSSRRSDYYSEPSLTHWTTTPLLSTHPIPDARSALASPARGRPRGGGSGARKALRGKQRQQVSADACSHHVSCMTTTRMMSTDTPRISKNIYPDFLVHHMLVGIRYKCQCDLPTQHMTCTVWRCRP